MISNSEFNQKLIDMISTCIPAKSDQLEMLMTIIPLGREAAYRRLRGDVPFSFSEACIISRKLGKSLDCIADVTKCGGSIFHLKAAEAEFPDDYSFYYTRLFEEHDGFFDMCTKNPTMKGTSAWNMVPHTKLLPFDYLAKFRAFQWKYQRKQGTKIGSLSDIELSSDLKKKIAKMLNKSQMVASTAFIFGHNTFGTLIRQVEYCRNLNLITNNEITILKEELIQLVNDMENLTMQGKDGNGNKIWVYLSNVDFESNYVYVSGENFECAYLDVYQINSLASTDPVACKMHREWIDSLRKYSTLISASGEKERVAYFNRQRKYIADLK